MIYIIFFLQAVIFAETNNLITLNTIKENSIQYISIQDFCKSQGLKYTYYESKEKLEIIYQKNKLYFSPLSSYMKINNTSYHLIYPTIFKQNIIYDTRSR